MPETVIGILIFFITVFLLLVDDFVELMGKSP